MCAVVDGSRCLCQHVQTCAYYVYCGHLACSICVLTPEYIVLSALLASTVYARTCDRVYTRTYIYAYTSYPVYHAQVCIHIQMRTCATHTHASTHIRRGDIHNRRRHGYGPFVPSYRRLISMFVLFCVIASTDNVMKKMTTRSASHALHAKSLIVGLIWSMCTVLCAGPSHNSTYQHV